MNKKTKLAHKAGFEHYSQYKSHVVLTCLNSIYTHPKYRSTHKNRLFRFRPKYIAENHVNDYFYSNCNCEVCD
jgi:hypothetical protein